MEFVDDPLFGVEKAVELFSSGCFAKRADRKDYLALFFKFVDDPLFGVEKAVELFSSNCFAKRADGKDYLALFLKFIADVSIETAIRLFKKSFARHVTTEGFLDKYHKRAKDISIPIVALLYSRYNLRYDPDHDPSSNPLPSFLSLILTCT